MKNIAFTPSAYSDYVDWLKTDKKLFLKITELIRESAKNPYKGIGKPEALKNEFSGFWSRRINKEHRLIYKVTEETSTLKKFRHTGG
jgi:toxin YoeB